MKAKLREAYEEDYVSYHIIIAVVRLSPLHSCTIHVAKHVSAMSTNFNVIHYRYKLLLLVYSVCNFFRLQSVLNM